MGKRIHVVKRVQEYGSCGFNWKQQEFKDLLDALGCDTSGEYYSDDFDCQVELYENALNMLKEYKDKGRTKELEAKFLENGLDFDLFEDALRDLESSGDNVLETMQSFYDNRDKNWDYICFAAW